MGFEPTTPTLARLCSTPELHPHPSPRHHTGTRRVCKIRPDFGRRDILPPHYGVSEEILVRRRSSLTLIKSFGMAQRARLGIHEHWPVHSILKPDSQARVHGFRARGLRPRPGMTTIAFSHT